MSLKNIKYLTRQERKGIQVLFSHRLDKYLNDFGYSITDSCPIGQWMARYILEWVDRIRPDQEKEEWKTLITSLSHHFKLQLINRLNHEKKNMLGCDFESIVDDFEHCINEEIHIRMNPISEKIYQDTLINALFSIKVNPSLS